MKLPRPSGQYSAPGESIRNRVLEQADAENHKRGRNLELGNGNALIFTDTDTGERYAATVASGVLVLTLLS